MPSDGESRGDWAELEAAYESLAAEVREKTLAQQLAERQAAVLEAINQLFRDVLTCETEAAAAAMALSLAQDLPHSAFGFICEINDRGTLDTIAISDTGWDACRVQDGRLVLAQDLPIRGIRGLVMTRRRSMVFNDPSSHPEWIAPPEGHPLLTAFMGVPLWLGDQVLGAIGLANRPDGYGEEELRSVEALSVAFTEALMRRRAEEKLRASLEEKDVLLRELHHRVKNNLQVISSLLALQARRVESTEAQEMFRESHNRVRSMALTHEQLYRTKNLTRVEFDPYLRDLTQSLLRGYSVRPGAVTCRVRAGGLSLPVDLAIPCGLMVNELVSNSLKHAFPDAATGRIEVSLTALDDGSTELAVTDDGCGLPPDLDFEGTRTLGLRLVRSLADQVDGRVDIEREGGTTFRIRFGA